jgi:hypothetical protein
MERMRLETFSAGKGWIHDKAKGHGANSKSVCRNPVDRFWKLNYD